MESSVALGLPGMSVAVGDHVCAFYRGEAGRDEILIPYLRAGIEGGDKCTAVLDEAESGRVSDALRVDCDVDYALATRQLDVLRSSEAYLLGGGFSQSAMLEFWQAAIGDCMSSGEYEFARSLGEMTWALRELPGVEDLLAYESELNRFLPKYPQVIVCLYDLDRFDGRVVVDLLRTHPKLLLCGSILDNPYYLEPDEFLALRESAPARLMSTTVDVTEDRELRGQLSRLDALLVLSMLMNESSDEQQIIHLGASAAPSFAACRLVGVRIVSGTAADWISGGAALPAAEDMEALPSDGGSLALPGGARGWAYALGGVGVPLGHMVVAVDRELDRDEQFLLRVLAQQIGAAIRNSRLHQFERRAAVELASVNAQLERTVQALQQRIDIHHRLTRAAASGEGMDGIARAVHEVTRLPVAIEDRYGNLRAWAGPGQPLTYPKDAPARREQLLRRLLREGESLWESGRVVRAASPRPDSIGVIALIDPSRVSGHEDLAALEYGATILSMELARLRVVADTEIRIRRDLVEDLLSGASPDTAVPRGEAFQHDLTHPHRVVVFEGRGRSADEDQFFTAVRRACRDFGLGSLLVWRAGTVVLLTDQDVDWDGVHAAVMRELAGGRCRIGVGGRTSGVEDFPTSHREATLALHLQRHHSSAQRVVAFDSLGVYRLLAAAEDPREVERFVTEWLGPLMEYDAHRKSELVLTLYQYLECGGRYAETASALVIHRSTLKYRLQRIREVSGLHLGESDVNFNLQLACRAWHTLQALKA